MLLRSKIFFISNNMWKLNWKTERFHLKGLKKEKMGYCGRHCVDRKHLTHHRSSLIIKPKIMRSIRKRKGKVNEELFNKGLSLYFGELVDGPPWFSRFFPSGARNKRWNDNHSISLCISIECRRINLRSIIKFSRKLQDAICKLAIFSNFTKRTRKND